MTGYIAYNGRGERAWMPLHDIAAVRGEDNQHGVCMAIVRRGKIGEPFSPTGLTFDDLMARPVQLLPAEPGIDLCHVDIRLDLSADISFSPVIAWALCFDGVVRPVCPSGVGASTSEPRYGWLVRMPDGRVEPASPEGDMSFESVEACLAYFSQEAADANAR